MPKASHAKLHSIRSPPVKALPLKMMNEVSVPEAQESAAFIRTSFSRTRRNCEQDLGSTIVAAFCKREFAQTANSPEFPWSKYHVPRESRQERCQLLCLTIMVRRMTCKGTEKLHAF